MMSPDEVQREAIETIREIALVAARAAAPEEAGSIMLAILISAYSWTVIDLLAAEVITLEDALRSSSLDFEAVQEKFREIAPNPEVAGDPL
jgi:hypothetical protein